MSISNTDTEFVVCVFATVYRTSDKEKDHPSPTVLEIPVKASSVDEAQKEIAQALGKLATERRTWRDKSVGMPVTPIKGPRTLKF